MSWVDNISMGLEVILNSIKRNNKKKMVYIEDTKEVCHELSELGKQAYCLLLEMKADEILFRAKHPIKYWISRFKNWYENDDFSWPGSNYPECEKYKDGFAYIR